MVHQNCSEFQMSSEPGPSTGQQVVQKVVMLTNFIENNRQKCEKYFPLEPNEEIVIQCPEAETSGTSASSGSEEDGNSFVIRNMGQLKKSGYTIRKLDVRYVKCGSAKVFDDKCKETVTVYHYWFHNWADHKCPKDVNALLNLSLDVLKNSDYDFKKNMDDVNAGDHCKCGESPKVDSKFVFPPLDGSETTPCEVKLNLSDSPLDFSNECRSPPTIVHCSAGIGRTGCLIAILNGIKQLSSEQKVDVLGLVCNMRLNRGGMVQNSEQYELIHKVLCLFEEACLPEL